MYPLLPISHMTWSFRSCAAKVPAWLGAQPGSFQNVSTGKVKIL